jgi:pyruvate formate lyase activating enzyme
MEIKGFIESSFIDWPGKICAVLFLPSCNLRCPFCHNPDLVFHPETLASFPWFYIEKKLTVLRNWLDGVCVTGGEPTLHGDLGDLLGKIRALGLSVKLDTNGTRPQILESLIDRHLIDYLAMDIKGPLDQESYRQCAGATISLAEIRTSMKLILSGRVSGEFRTTVIPAWHTPPVLARMALELKQAPIWRQQVFRSEQAMNPALCAESPSPALTSH